MKDGVPKQSCRPSADVQVTHSFQLFFPPPKQLTLRRILSLGLCSLLPWGPLACTLGWALPISSPPSVFFYLSHICWNLLFQEKVDEHPHPPNICCCGLILRLTSLLLFWGYIRMGDWRQGTGPVVHLKLEVLNAWILLGVTNGHLILQILSSNDFTWNNCVIDNVTWHSLHEVNDYPPNLQIWSRFHIDSNCNGCWELHLPDGFHFLTMSISPHDPVKQALLPILCRLGDWNSERLSHLLKVTQSGSNISQGNFQPLEELTSGWNLEGETPALERINCKWDKIFAHHIYNIIRDLYPKALVNAYNSIIIE